MVTMSKYRNYRGIVLGCSVAEVFMREMARMLGRFT